MTHLIQIASNRSALLVLASVCSGAVFLWQRAPEPPSSEAIESFGFPELFSEEPGCPRPRNPVAMGRRSEELGLLRADRYTYNPRDGVIAVKRFRQAASCYRSADAEDDLRRAERAAEALSQRVNTDYAAARLNLFNALKQERWSDALGEIRRLLLLTEHTRRHEYVKWLEKNIGRVAARASLAS